MPSPAEPPALCAACGRDVDRGADDCACGNAVAPWFGGDRIGLGQLLTQDAGGWVVGPLTGFIFSLYVSAPGHELLALLGFCFFSAFAALFFLQRREWRTASGARALTHFGRLVRAHGRGDVAFPLAVRGYEALRGDHAVVLAHAPRAHLCDGRPHRLGENIVENGMLLALLGGASRGVVRLSIVRTIDWTRKRSKTRMASPDPEPWTVSAQIEREPLPEEDAFLHACLAQRSGRHLSASGYRDTPLALSNDARLLRYDVAGFFGSGVPSGETPRSWTAGYAVESLPADALARLGRLVDAAENDDAIHDLIAGLLRAIRSGSALKVERPSVEQGRPADDPR